MTNEEAKVFLDNLKICINEHPIVADWLVEIADRKDEPQNYCDDCLYTDTCDSKEFFYACTSKATISKMEQVDKDINVRSKDKPQTERSACDTCFWYNSGIPCGVEPSVCNREVEDEPQTERSEQMGISEEKMKIVINNYFKSECDVNTSIREAFEKGFRIGVKKGLAQSKADTPQTEREGE